MCRPSLCSPWLAQVPFSRVLYIEQSDFRLVDSKDYYGLAPGKSVMLRCGAREGWRRRPSMGHNRVWGRLRRGGS